MSACSGGQRTRNLLTIADSLVNADPDSAYRLLSSLTLSSDSMPEALRMRCELLKAKAQNKAFIPFGTDTVMTAVAEWCDRHGDISEKMMSQYLLGCVYRDLNDAPRALVHYNNALEFADTTSADCDWHTLCRIHGQMGTLFHKMASPEYELKEWENTYSTAMKARDTIMAYDAYGMKACTYFQMYVEDSVISITKNMVDIYERFGRKDYAAGQVSAIIDVYLNRKEYDKAKVYMDYYERYSGFFDANGDIESGKEPYYGTKAEYYNGVGQADSAYMYLRKLMKFTDNIHCAEVAYRELMAYYEKQNKADSVIKYARLFCRMNDSSAIVRSAEEVNRTQSLYNYNKAQQIARDKAEEADRNLHAVIVVIVMAAVITTILYRRYAASLRRRRAEYTEKSRMYNELMEEHDKAVREKEMMVSDFERYSAEKENKIKDLENLISSYHGKDIDIDLKDIDIDLTDNEWTMRKSEVAKILHKHASTGREAMEHELDAATRLVEDVLPGFFSKISSPEYKLTEHEVRVCVLIRLNFIPSEIAVLFNISQQRVTNIRSRINKKLFNAGGATQLDRSLKRLN